MWYEKSWALNKPQILPTITVALRQPSTPPLFFFPSPSLHVLISISPCLSDTHVHILYTKHTHFSNYPILPVLFPFLLFCIFFLLFSFSFSSFTLIFSTCIVSFSVYLFCLSSLHISLLSLFIKHILSTRCNMKYVEL